MEVTLEKKNGRKEKYLRVAEVQAREGGALITLQGLSAIITHDQETKRIVIEF